MSTGVKINTEHRFMKALKTHKKNPSHLFKLKKFNQAVK